jgi:hypothetical protein
MKEPICACLIGRCKTIVSVENIERANRQGDSIQRMRHRSFERSIEGGRRMGMKYLAFTDTQAAGLLGELTQS